MKNIVNLRRQGGFYSCYDDDAYIIHYLFNYKIIDRRVGFPVSVIEKITSKLDELNINYESDFASKSFDKKNKYSFYVKKGKKKFDLSYRIDEIIKNLSKLSESQLDDILSYIEEKIDKDEK